MGSLAPLDEDCEALEVARVNDDAVERRASDPGGADTPARARLGRVQPAWQNERISSATAVRVAGSSLLPACR